MINQYYARVFAATTVGIDAHLIEVEADLSFGLVNFFIVGLPDKAIKESKDRVKAALKNCGLKLPDKLITINLAPVDIKKQDALFDVPIAIALLVASNLILLEKEFLDETLFLGELSLDGSIRPIKGALPITHGAKKAGKRRIFLPKENTLEACAIDGIEIIGVATLSELVSHLRGEIILSSTPSIKNFFKQNIENKLDYSQVKGQVFAKKALVIAAAGGHNILFVGPPGAGKTMLAERLPTIMPPLTFEEAIEITKVYSVAGQLKDTTLLKARPFRSPHHTVSQVGLSGGGSSPLPGEISLAHHGVLFLDELTEFVRNTIEILRQPMESNKITISRASCTVTYPANFLLAVAFNPCPCGYYKDASKKCTCGELAVKKYLGKLSGPLLDRIDIHVNVTAVQYDDLADNSSLRPISSEEMRMQVNLARRFRSNRGQKIETFMLNPDEIKEFCKMSEAAEIILRRYFEKFGIGARSYHKILKIARTIADVSQKELIDEESIRQAIFFRVLDKAL